MQRGIAHCATGPDFQCFQGDPSVTSLPGTIRRCLHLHLHLNVARQAPRFQCTHLEPHLGESPHVETQMCNSFLRQQQSLQPHPSACHLHGRDNATGVLEHVNVFASLLALDPEVGMERLIGGRRRHRVMLPCLQVSHRSRSSQCIHRLQVCWCSRRRIHHMHQILTPAYGGLGHIEIKLI